MKIGLVCPYNMFRGGGVQECVLALKDGISAKGHEAYIITPQPLNNKTVIEKKDGMIYLGGSVSFRAVRTQGDISASVDTNALEAVLEREKFDILHFHEPWNPMLSRQILLRSEAINIATFHAAMSERRTSRTVERVIIPYTKSILKYLDAMTAVSPTATNYVKTLTKRKLTIIPNGIDLKKYTFSDGLSSKKHKTILYIGRLEKRKGVKYLLDAFSLVRNTDPSFELLIAGDGPERSKLEAYMMEQGIKGVHFLGYIDEPTKLRLLHEATIFCSPALYGESFGIVLLEAMASGCVTVAGNNSGYASVMEGRGQLSLVNPKDTTEFARRLILLGTDNALRSAWRDWAKEAVRKYDYQIVIDQYIELYASAHQKKHAKLAHHE
jgi:phosphatidyl-myo-inositol alpha-mannosyltransferase